MAYIDPVTKRVVYGTTGTPATDPNKGAINISSSTGQIVGGTPVPGYTPPPSVTIGGPQVGGSGIGSPPASQLPPVTPPPTAAPYDPSIELEALRKAQTARIVGGLTNRYNQTIAGINANKAKVDPTQDAKRVQVQVGSRLKAKNFAEYLANKGLSRAGTSQQSELTRTSDLQNAYNDIETQRGLDTSYYTQQADSANTSFNQDINNAQSQIESDYLTQLIQTKTKRDEMRRTEDLQRELNQANLTQKERQLYRESIDKEKDRIAAAEKSGYDLQDKAISRQIQTAGITGQVPISLILQQMSPEEINAYESIPDYQAVINQTQDPTQKAILNFFRNSKIQGSADLMSQYGGSMQNSYIPTQSAMDSNRKYNFETGKYENDFNYKSGQDAKNFDYKQGQDQLDYEKWKVDYGLREWTAKDASSRGWSGIEISRQANADANSRGWASINRADAKDSDAKLVQTEKEIDSQVGSMFSTNEFVPDGSGNNTTKASGRRIMGESDKVAANSYLDELTAAGVSPSVIKSVRLKRGLKE